MPPEEAPDVLRMQRLTEQWEAASDPRAIFLRCYLMMTLNMFAAVEQGEFNDPAWVERLLHRFADYYFVALDAYEKDPDTTPGVWRLAHHAAQEQHTLALQKLLVGVDAHINFDLVLALVDMLAPEWTGLSDGQRASRYRDHCHVNEVIGRTIDAVQDQVLEPAMPAMELIDRLFGSLDEKLISVLISGWRETVWENAVRLLEAPGQREQQDLVQHLEADALRLGRLILL